MDKNLLELMNIMREELNLYRMLIDQLQKKTDFIIEGNAAALIQSSEEESSIAVRIRACENQFLSLCKCISEEAGIALEEFSLTHLMAKLEHSMAHQLRQVAVTFSGLVSQVKQLNQRNMVLLATQLNYSNAVAQIIYRSATCYESSGAQSAPDNVASQISRQV